MQKPALWIMVAASLPRHPKIFRLSQTLNISLPEALGRLILLWIYALEFRRDGRFFSKDEIIAAAQWTGDADAFLNALTSSGGPLQSGFIEETPDGCFVLHDWLDFSGKNSTPKKTASAARTSKEKNDNIKEDNRTRTGTRTPEGKAAAAACFAAVMEKIHAANK